MNVDGIYKNSGEKVFLEQELVVRNGQSLFVIGGGEEGCTKGKMSKIGAARGIYTKY